MKKVHLYLKTLQIRKLKALAKETGAPMAVWVRKAIDQLLERRKAEKKEGVSHGK